MNEAKKTNAFRGPEFVSRFMNGKVIDIGAGPDLVCDWAERFDVEDGDANVITKYRQAGAYDAVHSSHCLEHMHDPRSALLEWWALLKPGGFMVTVVPHEDLYEQGIWPSVFNPDHKATFRLDKSNSWSPRSFDIRQIHAEASRQSKSSAPTYRTLDTIIGCRESMATRACGFAAPVDFTGWAKGSALAAFSVGVCGSWRFSVA